MREIKFRGMLRNGEWVYGGYVKTTQGASCILSGECDHLELDGETKNILRFNAVKYKTVGEYTGLKDSEVKDEYFGDIIEEDDGTRRVIEDECSVVSFRIINGKNIKYFWDLLPHKVIGNIYENPVEVTDEE